MDFASILVLVASKFPVALMIFAALGTLVVLAQAVVIFTPSKADDVKWEAIKAKPILGSLLSALINFAVIQKK